MLFNFLLYLRVFEVFCAALTGFSLLGIAIHEIWGSNGWREPVRKQKKPRGHCVR
jgi:hypothetical protein